MPAQKSQRTTVFISYSHTDESWLKRLRVHLKSLKRRLVVDVWDDSVITPGSDWKKEIEKALKAAKVAVLLVSADYLASDFIAENELPPLLKAAQEEGALIVPVIVAPSRFEKEEELSHFQAINNPGRPLISMTQSEQEAIFDKVAGLIESVLTDAPTDEPRSKPGEAGPAHETGKEDDRLAAKQETQTPFRRPVKKLCDKLSEAQWQFLEHVAIKAATTGGVVAMTRYRQEIQWPAGLERQDESAKNPSTVADLEATSAILQALDPDLSRLARNLHCSLTYLGEETRYESWLKEQLSEAAFQRITPADSFFTDEDNVIRVILDGIDGTGCFSRGIPLFCSSVGIIISNRPRVSAIYDPIHHIVYSALRPGSSDADGSGAAWAWQVATGSRLDLKKLAVEAKQKPLREEAIGVHLTRSNRERLHEFLETRPDSPQSMLERLARASGAVYAFNSGTVTLVDIAEGALGGFVNNLTNLWDVAPGEVLVEVCRGKVTDFDGAPVDYSYAHKVAVVAAKRHLHQTILDILK